MPDSVPEPLQHLQPPTTQANLSADATLLPPDQHADKVLGAETPQQV